MIPAPAEWWARVHSDAVHPGTREECIHCQAMIAEFGPMPSVEAITLELTAVGQDPEDC